MHLYSEYYFYILYIYIIYIYLIREEISFILASLVIIIHLSPSKYIKKYAVGSQNLIILIPGDKQNNYLFS